MNSMSAYLNHVCPHAISRILPRIVPLTFVCVTHLTLLAQTYAKGFTLTGSRSHGSHLERSFGSHLVRTFGSLNGAFRPSKRLSPPMTQSATKKNLPNVAPHEVLKFTVIQEFSPTGLLPLISTGTASFRVNSSVYSILICPSRLCKT